jgi:hypothetical protein
MLAVYEPARQVEGTERPQYLQQAAKTGLAEHVGLRSGLCKFGKPRQIPQTLSVFVKRADFA